MSTTFKLGGDLQINRLGYGAMRLSGQPGNFGPYWNWASGIELLRCAAKKEWTFFDSARSYGPVFVDRLIGEALEGLDTVVATKGGLDKSTDNRLIVNRTRDKLLAEVDEALANLRRDQIDLFQLHRIDPQTPFKVSISALMEAHEDGRIRHIGLSKVTREQLDQALDIGPIASVQNRLNIEEIGDNDMVDYTAERGIAFIAYGPLDADPMKPGAKIHPRVALPWLMARSPNIIAIPSTTSLSHLKETITIWEKNASLAN